MPVQSMVIFKHLALLKIQTDLQRIQGGRIHAVDQKTYGVLRNKPVQEAFLKKKNCFEKEFECILYIIMCEFLNKTSVNLLTGVSDTSVSTMHVVKKSV